MDERWSRTSWKRHGTIKTVGLAEVVISTEVNLARFQVFGEDHFVSLAGDGDTSNDICVLMSFAANLDILRGTLTSASESLEMSATRRADIGGTLEAAVKNCIWLSEKLQLRAVDSVGVETITHHTHNIMKLVSSLGNTELDLAEMEEVMNTLPLACSLVSILADGITQDHLIPTQNTH